MFEDAGLKKIHCGVLTVQHNPFSGVYALLRGLREAGHLNMLKLYLNLLRSILNLYLKMC